LGIGHDPGLEDVGQSNVLVADMGLKDFVEPSPMPAAPFGGFENGRKPDWQVVSESKDN
jgi:hypothetical protein